MRHKKVFLGTTINESFILDGMNVFNGNETDRRYFVKDPIYKKYHKADVYIVKGENGTHNIALAEFSNGVFGVYLIK